MKWLAFATDFDGTIATDGVLDEATRAALIRIRTGGATTILVTGRELKDFAPVPEVLDLFDCVVAENGGVLYSPSTKQTQVIGSPAPPDFAAELVQRGVPVTVGHVIVATVEPHEHVVLELIKEKALQLQVIFNKGAVMVLPAGVNKASGLQVALEGFGLELSDVVGVGDAENDSAFLEHCGLSVAVANALPALKERVKYVTQSNAGAGVAELVDSLLRGELDVVDSKEAT